MQIDYVLTHTRTSGAIDTGIIFIGHRYKQIVFADP